MFLVARHCDGIINSTTRLHLVGSFYEFHIMMHESMNIKFVRMNSSTRSPDFKKMLKAAKLIVNKVTYLLT